MQTPPDRGSREAEVSEATAAAPFAGSPAEKTAGCDASSPLQLAALRIGSLLVDPPLLQAPMAGFTNFAYRQVLRQCGGVGLPATEMFSARGFLGRSAKAEKSGDPANSAAVVATAEFPERLWGVKEEPRPLAVQIWDNDPVKLAQVGARLAHDFHVSVVDLNFGCPVRDVSEKAESGSYLLRDPDRIGAIVAAVVAACAPVPVTAKIRLGPNRDMITAADVAQAVEGAGGAALTVHGRTAADLFRGHADWDAIARIKPHLHHIPLIGNGDITSPQAAVAAFRRYGVDGVMIGRAAINRPWLFRQAQAALNGKAIPCDPSLAEQKAMLLEHYELICRRFGNQRGTILMRKFACRYASGHAGAREFRGRITLAQSPEDFRGIVDRLFPHDP